MIVYDNRDLCQLLCRRTGSLLNSPNVLIQTGLSCSIGVIVFQWPDPLHLPEHAEWPAWVYSTVLAFAIIFRTALAYARFWQGISSSVSMLSLWRGAYVNLNAFIDASIVEHEAKGSHSNVEALKEAKGCLLHWFSLLFAVAIQTLQWREDPDPLRPMTKNELDEMDKRRFWHPLADRERCERIFILAHTSRREREHLEAAFDKLTHIVHWIEYEVSLLHLFKRLLISSPILTRVYEDLSGGTLAYCQAHTIAFIPFPFLFAQVLSYALWAFVFLCPFIVQASLNESEVGLKADVSSWPALVIMNVILVAGFSCLNEIATELEDPFREKNNNFPVRVLQHRVDWSIASVAFTSSPRDFDLNNFGEETVKFQKWCEDVAAENCLQLVQSGGSVSGPPMARSSMTACEDLRRSVTECVRALEVDSMELWKDMRRTELELCGLAFRVLASDGRGGHRRQAIFYDEQLDDRPLAIADGAADVPEEHCPGRPADPEMPLDLPADVSENLPEALSPTDSPMRELEDDNYNLAEMSDVQAFADGIIEDMLPEDAWQFAADLPPEDEALRDPVMQSRLPSDPSDASVPPDEADVGPSFFPQAPPAPGPEPERSRSELQLRALLRRSAAVNGRMAPLLIKAMCFDHKGLTVSNTASL